MLDFLFVLALLVSVILAIGETLILVKTDKYWPLSLDDYLACALLTYSALTLEQTSSQFLMLATWSMMAGNLYAMLFTRMDPKGGSRERLGALTALLVCSVTGAASTFFLITL